MEKTTFDYKEVMRLGFMRDNINDSVFHDEYGYGCFYVTKNLTKRLVLDWDSTTHEIELIRYDKKSNVLNRIEKLDHDFLIKIIGLFEEADFTTIAC